MRLQQQTIIQIRELFQSGKSKMEIASIIGVSYNVIRYWLLEDEGRKTISKKALESFMKKPFKERREVYKRRREYIREYRKRRYHSDEAFRKREIARTIEYRRRKHLSQGSRR